MKYLKTYENINDEPQVGDYVLCEINDADDDVVKFVENNIGQIYNITDNYRTIYEVQYKNVPPNSTFYGIKNLIGLQRHHIKYYSNNKKEIEMKLTEKKYNL